MALDIKKFINRFLDEAREQLRILEEGLGDLRNGSGDADLVNRLFRAAHTLKGSSRMLKLLPVSETAHSLEDVLGALREQRISADDALIDLMLEALDSLDNLIAPLNAQPDPSVVLPKSDSLCARLSQAASGTDSPDENASQPTPANTPAPPAEPADTRTVAGPEPVLRAADSVRLRLNNLEQLIRLMSEVSISQAGLHELLADARNLRQDWESHALAHGNSDNPLLQRFQHFYQQLYTVINSQQALVYNLHQQSLGLRMLPLTHIFEPARKLVRELGRELGKQIDLQVQGEEIELDRMLIERLTEPVQHLLRNALDHGLETPEQRQQIGKNPRGIIQLNARQDGGWVIIDISDDGAGLDVEKIRQKVLRQNLLTEEELAKKSLHEIRNFIFLPGFSTSGLITELSGRGVGLDVVKRGVEDLQGMVEVDSQPGNGATFRLRLPLSLAMLRILLVQVQGHYLGFTAQHIYELIRIQPDSLLNIADRRVFVLHNEFIPVFQPADLMGLPTGSGISDNDSDKQGLLMLVLHVQGEKVALQIDQLVDEKDLVVRPLPAHLACHPLVAGIVNHGYQRLVSLIHVPHLLTLTQHMRSERPATTVNTSRHILVVDDSLNTREIEKDLLEAWGYQVTLAEDGQDGLIKARNGSFDAVLTDVEMPIMDGFTLTSHLRQEEAYKHTPIIIITSREKDSDRRRGMEVGADAYIVKGSFDQNSLIDTLKVLLG